MFVKLKIIFSLIFLMYYLIFQEHQSLVLSKPLGILKTTILGAKEDR